MGDKAKGPVMLLVILLIAAIAAAVLGFISLQKEKEKNVILTEEKERLEVQKRSAEKQITDLKGQIDDLKQDITQKQAKIKDFDNQLTLANNELTLEKEAKESALAELSGVKSTIGGLTSAKSALEAELKASKEALDDLRNQLTTIETAKQSLEQKLKESEVNPKVKDKDVQQLDKIVVTPAAGNAPAVPAGDISPAMPVAPAPSTADVPQVSSSEPAVAPLEGKVLVVNKEYDFIVVNLGQKENVGIGQTIELFRKDKKLGQAKVEEVRDTMSVATPVTKDMIKQVKEDDRAVLLR